MELPVLVRRNPTRNFLQTCINDVVPGSYVSVLLLDIVQVLITIDKSTLEYYVVSPISVVYYRQ